MPKAKIVKLFLLESFSGLFKKFKKNVFKVYKNILFLKFYVLILIVAICAYFFYLKLRNVYFMN